MDLKLVYLILFFVSILELVIFNELTPSKINKNHLFLYMMVIASNFGYSVMIYSDKLQTALIGDFISYIGSIFTIMFMLNVVVEMCNKKFFLPVRAIVFISALTISILMATSEHTNLFFKNPHIISRYGMTTIAYEKGPIMYFYIFYLAVINLSAIIMVTWSILSNKKVSKSTLQSLLFMLIFGTLMYVVPLFLGSKINFMPFTYVIMESFFIYVSAKASAYDLPYNLMKVYKSRGSYGYIAFDYKKRLLGYDEFAVELFPSLSKISIDSIIPDNCTDIIEKLHYKEDSWNWDDKCEQDFKISDEERSAICTIHSIKAVRRRSGYLFELRDDTEQQNYIKGINSYNKELSRLVGEKTRQVTDMQDSIIKGMAIMVESRDNSTGGHILRTSDCIQIFAEELLKHKELTQINPQFCNLLIKAAPMHDLGKIAVDDSILRKPGIFNDDEYDKMKKHAAKGAIIVRKILNETSDKDFERIAVNVAHYHHEKWNGEGYPEHLKGEEIPLEARIMALADVFDALVSKRCYKEAKSFDEAFEIIKNDLGKHFDPVIGQIFIDCRPKLESYYNSSLQEL